MTATQPPGRRQVLADAAIDLIATGGIRALTHRAVDAAAGLPAGSASNLFRSRRELLRGVLDRIAQLSSQRIAAAGPDPARPAPPPLDRQAEIDGIAAVASVFVERQLTTYRSATLARYACQLEASVDPQLTSLLHAGDAFERLASDAVARLGVANPVPAGRSLVALIDGLTHHRLVGTAALRAGAFRAADRAEVADAVRAYLTGLRRPAG